MSGNANNIVGGILWWLIHFGKNSLNIETSEKYFLRNQITTFIFNLTVITSIILYFNYF